MTPVHSEAYDVVVVQILNKVFPFQAKRDCSIMCKLACKGGTAYAETVDN
jgi:hypothetical protein